MVLGGGLWQDKEAEGLSRGQWEPLKGFEEKDSVSLRSRTPAPWHIVQDGWERGNLSSSLTSPEALAVVQLRAENLNVGSG